MLSNMLLARAMLLASPLLATVGRAHTHAHAHAHAHAHTHAHACTRARTRVWSGGPLPGQVGLSLAIPLAMASDVLRSKITHFSPALALGSFAVWAVRPEAQARPLALGPSPTIA